MFLCGHGVHCCLGGQRTDNEGPEESGRGRSLKIAFQVVIRLPSAGGQVVARSGVAYVTLLGGGLSIIEGVDTLQPRLVSTIEAGRILTDPQVRDDSLW